MVNGRDKETTGLVVAWWCSVGLVIERSRVRLPAAAFSGNDLGQVVHTNVPLFTKQYNLVPCKGFHVNAPVCCSQWHGPMNKGSIVVAVLQLPQRDSASATHVFLGSLTDRALH